MNRDPRRIPGFLAMALVCLTGCHQPDVRLAASGERVLRVAVCQTLCIDGDREGNLRRIENALQIASRQGADLACFPETAILGWVNPEAHELADPIPGPASERIGRMAREYGMMVSVGLAERASENLYDSVILVGADGALLLKHRKVNIIAELMEPPYARGSAEDLQVIDTPIGRVGMLICADTFEEELVRRIGDHAPDLLIVPYGWAATKEMWPEHGESLRQTVTRTSQWAGCPVIATDLVGMITHGPWKGSTYGGQSVVLDGEQNVLAVLRDRDVEVRIVELPIALTR